MQLNVSTYFEKWHYRFLIIIPFAISALCIMRFYSGGILKSLSYFLLIPFIFVSQYIHHRTGTAIISSEGIAFKRGPYRWDKVREVGIGSSRILFRRHDWIYFSAVPLAVDEIQSLPVKRCGKIELSSQNLEAVRSYYAGPIRNLTDRALSRSDAQIARIRPANLNFYAIVCVCLVPIMIFFGLTLRTIRSDGYAKSTALQTTDLFKVTGTITSCEPNGATARLFINNVPYRAEVVPPTAMQKLKNAIGSEAEACILKGTNVIGTLNMDGASVLKLDSYKSYLNKQAEIVGAVSLLCFICALYFAVLSGIYLLRVSKSRRPSLTM